MKAPQYSISEKQSNFLSIGSTNNSIFVNNLPLYLHKHKVEYPVSYSNFDNHILPMYDFDEIISISSVKEELGIEGVSITSVIVSKVNSYTSEWKHGINRYVHEPFKSTVEYLVEEGKIFNFKKIVIELKEKINNIYSEHQNENWDGYNAEPLKYLQQSLKFADAFLFEPKLLIESMDIVPENDGCLCFEWFKSKDKFISISVKGDKLIYNYKIGAEEGCGETNFSGKQTLIERIKKVVLN